jgi:Domain of unknown function (DUF3597)
MGMFSGILAKLGFGDKKVAAAEAAPAAPVETPVADAGAADAVIVPMDPVDVVAQMEALASASSQPLNWKTSIVDLLKLLDIDSSFAARKELATELECPTATMADSASMNMWLHKTVLAKIAENGGNIPDDLL